MVMKKCFQILNSLPLGRINMSYIQFPRGGDRPGGHPSLCGGLDKWSGEEIDLVIDGAHAHEEDDDDLIDDQDVYNHGGDWHKI